MILAKVVSYTIILVLTIWVGAFLIMFIRELVSNMESDNLFSLILGTVVFGFFIYLSIGEFPSILREIKAYRRLRKREKSKHKKS